MPHLEKRGVVINDMPHFKRRPSIKRNVLIDFLRCISIREELDSKSRKTQTDRRETITKHNKKGQTKRIKTARKREREREENVVQWMMHSEGGR